MTGFTDTPADQATQVVDQEATAPVTESTPFLVHGDRVYKTQEDLINKLTSADTHIRKLEEERSSQDGNLIKVLDKIDSLEANDQTSTKVEELLTKLNTARTTSETNPEVSTAELVKSTTDQVLEALKEQDQVATSERNSNACMTAAKEAYGDTFNQVIVDKAKKLGMDVAYVNRVASESPEAFKQLFISVPPSSGSRSGTISNAAIDNPGDAGQPKRKAFMKMTAKERLEDINRRMTELNKGS